MWSSREPVSQVDFDLFIPSSNVFPSLFVHHVTFNINFNATSFYCSKLHIVAISLPLCVLQFHEAISELKTLHPIIIKKHE